MSKITSKIIANGILRAVGVLVGIALLILFIYKIQSAIVYLIVASVLSLIARPLLTLLRDKLKLPNTISVVITMSIFILAIFGIISLFIPLIAKQGQNLSLLNTEALHKNIKGILIHINNYFQARGADLFSEIKNIDFSSNLKAIPSLFKFCFWELLVL